MIARLISCAALVVTLLACRGPSEQQRVLSLPLCGDVAPRTGELSAEECRIDASDYMLHVIFRPVAADATGGVIDVQVLDSGGNVTQTLTEENVSEYLYPSAQDVDQDGYADVLIGRESGNVNVNYAIWRFNPESRHFERLGEASGVSIDKTAEGYLAVPARGSAASWGVSFYRIEGPTRALNASVEVSAEGMNDDGQVTGITCALAESPGIASLNLTEEQAREKFCAEPAAQVFN